MLIVAAAAGAEVPAARCDTVRGGLKDFEQPGPAPMRMGFHNLDGDALAGKCKGDKDHTTVCVAAEGIASVGHAFQPELQVFQGGRTRGGASHGSCGVPAVPACRAPVVQFYQPPG